MARLIALDASVAIAALSLQDAHHGAASAALTSIEDADELVLGATTRTEILIGPHRIRGRALQAALDFIGGCATIPVTAPIADAAAVLKQRIARSAFRTPSRSRLLTRSARTRCGRLISAGQASMRASGFPRRLARSELRRLARPRDPQPADASLPVLSAPSGASTGGLRRETRGRRAGQSTPPRAGAPLPDARRNQGFGAPRQMSRGDVERRHPALNRHVVLFANGAAARSTAREAAAVGPAGAEARA